MGGCSSREDGAAVCSQCKTRGIIDPPRGSGKKKLQPCPRCRKTLYCGRTCQKQHWKVHKQDCVARKGDKDNSSKHKCVQAIFACNNMGLQDKQGYCQSCWEREEAGGIITNQNDSLLPVLSSNNGHAPRRSSGHGDENEESNLSLGVTPPFLVSPQASSDTSSLPGSNQHSPRVSDPVEPQLINTAFPPTPVGEVSREFAATPVSNAEELGDVALSGTVPQVVRFKQPITAASSPSSSAPTTRAPTPTAVSPKHVHRSSSSGMHGELLVGRTDPLAPLEEPPSLLPLPLAPPSPDKTAESRETPVRVIKLSPSKRQPSASVDLPSSPLPSIPTSRTSPFTSPLSPFPTGPYISSFGVDTSRKISDHYTINNSALLGSGITSVVKVCTDRHGVEYACKIINKKDSGIDEEKFREEIRLLRKLKHPNIMSMTDVFEDELCIYIVTELMCGGELFDRILEKKCFSERDAANYTHKILTAVAYLHSHGITHRDLKPENLLFTELGDAGELKLVDFGFALDLMNEKRMMQAQAQLGTQGYAAPEIFNQTSYDEKCDVWSVGVIAYIMLSGLPPFIEYSEDTNSPFWVYVNRMSKNPTAKLEFPPALFKKVTVQAQNFCKLCLEKNPLRRARSTDLLHHPWFKVARGVALEKGRGQRWKYMTMTVHSQHNKPFELERARQLYQKGDNAALDELISQSTQYGRDRSSTLPDANRSPTTTKSADEENMKPSLLRSVSEGPASLADTDGDLLVKKHSPHKQLARDDSHLAGFSRTRWRDQARPFLFSRQSHGNACSPDKLDICYRAQQDYLMALWEMAPSPPFSVTPSQTDPWCPHRLQLGNQISEAQS
eukprot:g53587.t1